MADNNYTCLNLEKDVTSSLDNPLDRQRSSQLREKLVAEIQALEEQLSALEASGDAIDFSMQQTCREMIHSRQQLYLELCR
ncbi:MAG: hypothetical protein V2I66_09985 [Halieaceae bacterium]|jgi:hypothetical protein|nr:hypothetical protein [Halieaceae bacterium]